MEEYTNPSVNTRTQNHTYAHIHAQKEIHPLAGKKMKGCTVRREAKGRQSERETDRERYKLRGKTQGMWWGGEEEESKMTYSEAVRQKSHVI